MRCQEINRINRPLKVLVVDDSPMMCKALENILMEDDEIEAVTKALNGKEALKELSSQKYDVCTLDVHMPGMNGLTVLKNIMIKYPVPTLMVSAFTSDGSKITFEALRYGAVDFFKKLTRDGKGAFKKQADSLRAKLKRASRVKVEAARYLRIKPRSRGQLKDEAICSSDISGVSIIYGSTGCYSSVLSILPFLKESLEVPIIISMDNSEDNIKAFVDYLKSYCIFPLKLAKGTETLHTKTIYFLPKDYAAYFDKKDNKWEMTVEKRPIKVEGEGAIDLTLLSASEIFGKDTLVTIVSGDNPFGLTGAKEVLRNKGKILVQKPNRCLAPLAPQLFLEEYGAESLESYEIVSKISRWPK